MSASVFGEKIIHLQMRGKTRELLKRKMHPRIFIFNFIFRLMIHYIALTIHRPKRLFRLG
jgi:hypothetical protein